MEITCKFNQGVLVIKAKEGKGEQKLILPAIQAELLMRELGNAVKIRGRVIDLEADKVTMERNIQVLKSSNEWKLYNEELLK